MQLRSKRTVRPRESPKSPPIVQQSKKTQEKPVETNEKPKISLKEALEKLYTDIKSAPSYSAKINEFLRDNHVHSVHRRIVKKKFPRRKIIARFPFDIWMGDLIEYPKYKYNNRQYVYILVLIDCFTKKVYAAPMRSKNMEWSIQAFESIFHHLNEFPTHLVTDGGLGKIILFSRNKTLSRIFQFWCQKTVYQLWNQSL